jgi:hypothetical protein
VTVGTVLSTRATRQSGGVDPCGSGAGRGEFYIPEEPRPAYFIVESEDLDWSFSVAEGVRGTPQ